jgi:hypothetical protein
MKDSMLHAGVRNWTILLKKSKVDRYWKFV